MAYLASKERESLIRRVNKSYAFRKILITVAVVALIAFIAVTIVSFFQWVKTGVDLANDNIDAKELVRRQCDECGMSWLHVSELHGDDTKITLSNFGIGMVIWAGLLILMGIWSIVLTFSAKSPSAVTEEVVQLASSPVAGRKLKAHPDIGEVVKERLTSRVELERQAEQAKAEAREKARKAREKAKKRR